MYKYKRNRVGIFDRLTRLECGYYIDNFEDKGITLKSFEEDKREKKTYIIFDALKVDGTKDSIRIVVDDRRGKAEVDFIPHAALEGMNLSLEELDLITDFLQFCEARDILVLFRALYPERELKYHDAV